MIISLNWLKKFTDIDMPVTELAELIGSRLVEIEEIIDYGAKFEGAVIVEVKKVQKHPNADKLHIVEIDDGKKVKNVKRLKNGLVQVVCGAPNVREGLKAVWLPPGSTVPETFDKEPFVLDARELRGVISNGMLASSKELAFGGDHSGILEVDMPCKAGDSFAKTYELDDFLLDIENKSLTHRPDCFGLIGFAREVAAISGKKFTTPAWLMALQPVLAEKQVVKGIQEPTVDIKNPKLCPRYEAVVLAKVNAKVGSPLIIQSYLNRVGVRSISAAVDVTNYLMLVSGQPLHSFDYDKIVKISGGKPSIVIRAAKEKEKLKLLDGRVINLNQEDIVICAGSIPVALAGAMGGFDTEVDELTENILLESAAFNLYNLRSTVMRHGISSEAATRFTKGQAPKQTAPVLASAVRMLGDACGAVRATKIIDNYPVQTKQPVIKVEIETINQVLGTELSVLEAVETLELAEMKLDVKAPYTIEVKTPYWRQDLHIAEDIIEEIGRLRGFDNIKPVLPRRNFTATTPEALDNFKLELRRLLARAGANEVLTYSFVPERLLKTAGQKPSEAYKIINALSPELQYYRLSLTPSLLDKIHLNIKAGFAEFALFEINKIHTKSQVDTAENLPSEQHMLALVYANKNGQTGYYSARRALDFMAHKLNLEFSYKPLETHSALPTAATFNHERSALVSVNNSEALGVIGEYNLAAIEALKLPFATAGFEIDIQQLFKALPGPSYQASSKFPSTTQDVCLRVNTKTSFAQVEAIFKAVLKKTSYDWHLAPLDIYQREDDKTHKQITFRLELADYQKTLVSSEVNQLVSKIVKEAKIKLNAVQI